MEPAEESLPRPHATTQLSVLRAERHERMERLGAVAGIVAHDFNNILVAILGFADLCAHSLRQTHPELTRPLDYLGEVKKGGERARRIVSQLLAFSRGGPQIIESVDLPALARELVEGYRPAVSGHIDIRLEMAGDLPVVRSDGSHIRRVLASLVDNACDALGEGGTLTISGMLTDIEAAVSCSSCERNFDGQYLALRVSDDGEGMTGEVLDRVFTPFFTTRGMAEGKGMGLCVVHGLVHQMGGHVVLESAPGQGCVVTIYFPETIFEVAPGVTGE